MTLIICPHANAHQFFANGWNSDCAATSNTCNEAAYRLRMGDYRILFDVEGSVIVIRKIGNRKNVYD